MSSRTPSQRELVAVIDDDEAVRDGLSSLLRSLGFAVEVFRSAEDFLLSTTESSACLIVDVRMPGMSGLELQRHLVASGSHPPIVFITAHADQDAESRALAAGAVAFLRKPCEEQVLVDCVKAAIARRHGGSRAPG